MRCYAFYRECRAVDDFPKDPLVRAYAAAFRVAEDEAEQVRSARTQAAVLGSLLRG